MHARRSLLGLVWSLTQFAALGTACVAARAADPTAAEGEEALRRAVTYFRTHAGVQGGYVFQVSVDGKLRAGEEPVGPTTAWIQPPATPAVGMAYLEAWRLTGDPVLKAAARETAEALLRGQLESGGWDNLIEFAPADRQRYAYRVDGPRPRGGKVFNTTTFDDDKSQSAVRFLMQLDRDLKFADGPLHAAALYALDAFVRAQFPNGAWPQRYSNFPDPAEAPVLKASLPADWPRKFPGDKYAGHYTLNDGTQTDLIRTLLEAWDIYHDERYLAAARRGGDFLLLAQLPEPQPGWAQQYDRQMHPVWARRFEPPAVSGGESQAVLQTLLLLYRRTGDPRYLAPVPRAIEYYRSCLRPDGKLARFYELGTNRPLYLTRQYELTYQDNDLPTHYGFIVDSRLDAIAAEYDRVRETPREKLWEPASPAPPKLSSGLVKRAAAIVGALSPDGGWVETGRIKVAGGDTVSTELLDSKTFSRNLVTLAQFVAAARGAAR